MIYDAFFVDIGIYIWDDGDAFRKGSVVPCWFV